MNAVVIFGAGASADFGVPTLRSIFKNVQARGYLQRDPELRQRLNTIFWQPRGQTLETSDESLTVEEMLTFIQDWEREGRIENRPARGDCEDLKRRLYILIYNAVFEGKSSQSRHLNPLLSVFRHSFERVTWVSFNWDCVFESSFYYWSGNDRYTRYNPHLVIPLYDWRNGPPRDEYLKLHGSINWWMVGDRLTYLPWAGGGPLVAKWADYASGRTTDYPVILEPSAYKYGGREYDLLQPQWEVFLDRLREANCILIIGYSLPEADFQARSKLMIAFQVTQTSAWGVIDPQFEIRKRYERVFGSSRLKTLDMGLAGFNNTILDNLRILFPGLDFRDQPIPAAVPQPAPQAPQGGP